MLPAPAPQSPIRRSPPEQIKRLQLRMQILLRKTPPAQRNRWFYEEHEELASTLAHEKRRLAEEPLPHAGCDSWLPPWHEECRIYDP